MHELAIAEEIKQIVLEKMKENKRKKVTRVGLIFGELTSVVPEALETAFSIASEGTAMQGAKIKCTIKKLKAKCKKCNKIFRVKDFNYFCPACKTSQVEITQGREMIVKSITME
jgi:hydrogenase nickel incorporation protein HypA/HybF